MTTSRSKREGPLGPLVDASPEPTGRQHQENDPDAEPSSKDGEPSVGVPFRASSSSLDVHTAMGLLNDDGLLTVTRAAATGPKTDLEIDAIIEWAGRTRFQAVLLHMVLDGTLLLMWDQADEQVRFTHAEDVCGPPDA